MRIGLVTERIGRALGGAERWTYDFARWLTARGHEVHVVCRADRRCELPPGAIGHDVECGRSQLAFGAAAAVRLEELPCDVTHDMGSGWSCDVFHPHCGSRTAAILRNTERRPAAWRPLSRAIQPLLPRYRKFAALCDRQYSGASRTYVAVSQMVADDFETHHGVASRQIRVIHNGVDTDRFSPALQTPLRRHVRENLGFAERDIVLLLVAHNPRLKGFDTLIDGAAELRRRGEQLRVLVVGSNRAARETLLCRRSGISAHFTGVVADPRPYYAAADVYVHPTFYDPCSLVVLEAWASGLPVITTRFNGCAELMREDLKEFIMPEPSDALDLARRIEPLLDLKQRRHIGERVRTIAEAHSADACFVRFLDVYGEVRAGQRAAA